MRFLSLLLCGWLSTGLPDRVLGQDSLFDPLGRNLMAGGETQVRIEVEWIEMKTEDYLTLKTQMEPKNPSALRSSNEGQLRALVEKRIQEKKATYVNSASTVTRPGQRTKIESITEYIYPTEFDPGRPVQASSQGNKDEAETEAPESGKFASAGSPASLPLATAFETRNLGITMEIDPQLGADNASIDISMAPELVYHLGETTWGTYREGESAVEVKMPRFYTVRVTTQITVVRGEPLLIGTVSPTDLDSGAPDPSRKILIFVKADLMLTGLPPEAPAPDLGPQPVEEAPARKAP